MTSDRARFPPVLGALIERGVTVHCPASVEVGAELNPERVAPDVVIHAGCRLRGAATSIGPGCELGAEGPLTLDDCRLGRGVSLKGGCVCGSVFLDGASLGSGAHVRPGTLLEEQAGGAHAVAFKQTLLFPFVTAGSLINFCDVLMAGGTGRCRHGEVGSSHVHFNFTPHGDKATASLVGDVPGGVMLDRPPIFLGGQGGLVGPVRVAFGCLLPAGEILRRDALEPGQMLFGGAAALRGSRSFVPGLYRGARRLVTNNLAYLGNILALRAWYEDVRSACARDAWAKACMEGAARVLDTVREERLRRLADLAGRLERSAGLIEARGAGESGEAAVQRRFAAEWPEMAQELETTCKAEPGRAERDRFLAAWEDAAPGRTHLEAVRSLDAAARKAGTAWLQAVVDAAVAPWLRRTEEV